MKKIEVLIALPLLVFLGAGDACAYIDPGTGSFVIQIVIGFILASVFTIKMYWLKIKCYLRNKFARTQMPAKPSREESTSSATNDPQRGDLDGEK